jgi:hypothetical protein
LPGQPGMPTETQPLIDRIIAAFRICSKFAAKIPVEVARVMVGGQLRVETRSFPICVACECHDLKRSFTAITPDIAAIFAVPLAGWKCRGTSWSEGPAAHRSRGSPHGRSVATGCGPRALCADLPRQRGALPKLTAEDLKDLGVVFGGHRRKLSDAIAAVGAAVPAAAVTAAAPDSPAQVKTERR